jgi:L-threonylcarbamoyladenylate synthase
MGRVVAVDQTAPAPDVVALATSVLEASSVLVMPTDSVYGIGCAATPANPALAEVFRIKERPAGQTLPLLVSSPDDLRTLAVDLAPGALRLAEKYWPGALTIVVRASDALAPEYVAADGTVAVRVPDSNLVRALAREVGPLAVTSANVHGFPAATSLSNLSPRLVAESGLVLDAGPAPVGVASSIIDATRPDPVVLREGAVPAHELSEVFYGNRS